MISPIKDFLPNTSLLKAAQIAFHPAINAIQNFGRFLDNNPEMKFIFISNFEDYKNKTPKEIEKLILNDVSYPRIKSIEKSLERNLPNLLELHDLKSLWEGSNSVLRSRNNPDKFRHCLVSLRTLIEFYLGKLSPDKEVLERLKKYDEEIKNHHGKPSITRKQKLDHLNYKFSFAHLEKINEHDLNFIILLYANLCRVHSPKLNYTTKQIRTLKAKAGVVIWLLAYLDKITSKEVLR